MSTIRFLRKKSTSFPKLNIFTGVNEPEKKDGIWLKKDITIENIQQKQNNSTEPSFILEFKDKSNNTISITLPSWIKQEGYNYLFCYTLVSTSNIQYLFYVFKGEATYVPSSVSSDIVNIENAYFKKAVSTEITNCKNTIQTSGRSSYTSGNVENFENYTKNGYICSKDIYKKNGTLRFKAPELDTLNPNTLLIIQKLLTYNTVLIDTNVANGLKTYFDDIIFSNENSEIDKAIETYYRKWNRMDKI